MHLESAYVAFHSLEMVCGINWNVLFFCWYYGVFTVPKSFQINGSTVELMTWYADSPCYLLPTFEKCTSPLLQKDVSKCIYKLPKVLLLTDSRTMICHGKGKNNKQPFILK